LKFFLKIELNKEKKSDAYKKMALEFILYLILLTAIVVIICLIICKMFIKKKTGKIIFICVMSFVGIVIVIIIVYSKNSDWKEKCKEKNVKYWKVMTKNEVENLRKTHKNDYDEELNDMRCSLDDWYLYFIKDIRQIIYLDEDE
jgi:glucan phosphoethanolaminetransferase (alkaline phosphatase superfamily)